MGLGLKVVRPGASCQMVSVRGRRQGASRAAGAGASVAVLIPPRREDDNPEDGVARSGARGLTGQQLVSSGLWLRSWARAVVNSARAWVAAGRNTAARWQFWKASRMPKWRSAAARMASLAIKRSS